MISGTSNVIGPGVWNQLNPNQQVSFLNAFIGHGAEILTVQTYARARRTCKAWYEYNPDPVFKFNLRVVSMPIFKTMIEYIQSLNAINRNAILNIHKKFVLEITSQPSDLRRTLINSFKRFVNSTEDVDKTLLLQLSSTLRDIRTGQYAQNAQRDRAIFFASDNIPLASLNMVKARVDAWMIPSGLIHLPLKEFFKQGAWANRIQLLEDSHLISFKAAINQEDCTRPLHKKVDLACFVILVITILLFLLFCIMGPGVHVPKAYYFKKGL